MAEWGWKAFRIGGGNLPTRLAARFAFFVTFLFCPGKAVTTVSHGFQKGVGYFEIGFPSPSCPQRVDVIRSLSTKVCNQGFRGG